MSESPVGSVLQDTRIVGGDPAKYLERLSRIEHILSGEYTQIGKDLYQTERIRKSLMNKSGQVTNNTLFARLKRTADVASHARELIPGRIHAITKADLLAHLRIVLGVTKTLPLVTTAELWKRHTVENVQAKNWKLLERAISGVERVGSVGDEDSGEFVDQVTFLVVLAKYTDEAEAGAFYSRIVAERVVMPFVLKAPGSLAGLGDCIEACRVVCRALEKLEQKTQHEFMNEVATLWRMCRGILGLLSPEPGICGCSSDDVGFATSRPDDPDMEAPLDLIRLTLAEEAYWQEKSTEYSSTLLSEKSSAATLAKHCDALRKGEPGALLAALSACPSLMMNLRAGATAVLEALILQAVDATIEKVQAPSLGEQDLWGVIVASSDPCLCFRLYDCQRDAGVFNDVCPGCVIFLLGRLEYKRVGRASVGRSNHAMRVRGSDRTLRFGGLRRCWNNQ